ncbi:hypothetical protein [Bacillus alkalisoli]|uniref:hypothetical protein n=1 Tax=Bacillus alkalisoli TaxID=2011008 RepID=UPI000C240126|nr:hypothetical protein [Bacillus alkalisoli]
MKKFFMLLITCSLIVIVIGCKNSVEETKKDVEQRVDEKEEETLTENEGQEEDVEEDNESPSNHDVDKLVGLQLYKPTVGMKKTFTDGEEPILTEFVIAENEDFIQFAYVIGGHAGTQIFKWTENEITLVYDEEATDYEKSMLDTFASSNNIEVVLSLDETAKASWELIETNSVVEVPYGTFEQVYVVKKITDEVEGAETIYTRYYAPKYGLIKETFEVTGEYGYKGETLLSNIE